jgi:hypothetical protein
MKTLFLALFVISLASSTYASNNCERSLVLEGKSPNHKLISSLAFNEFTSKKFYDYVIPSMDEPADLVLVMHEVGIRPGAGQLELTCHLELRSLASGSLGTEVIKMGLAQYTSTNAQDRYLRRSCLSVVKKLFKRIPMCPYWTPPHF